jgi:energy-coupling factor transport system ATP-binding protein
MKDSSIIISLDNVTVRYSNHASQRYAIHELSLDLYKGSWTTIVGSNGSGKSTLAKVLAGLCPITSGNIVKVEPTILYTVLQNPETQILGDTIFEEISLCLKDENEQVRGDKSALIRSIIEQVGLTLPLDTTTSKMSGGQKQLLNMASSLAAGANILIMDEVSSMLDLASRVLVLQAAERLHNQGVTIVWITHRSEEIGYADRVISLEQGQISYDGTSEHFLYGHSVDLISPCEQRGMELPYVVKVVKQLEKRGYSLSRLPLLPSQLSQATIKLCHSL